MIKSITKMLVVLFVTVLSVGSLKANMFEELSGGEWEFRGEISLFSQTYNSLTVATFFPNGTVSVHVSAPGIGNMVVTQNPTTGVVSGNTITVTVVQSRCVFRYEDGKLYLDEIRYLNTNATMSPQEGVFFPGGIPPRYTVTASGGATADKAEYWENELVTLTLTQQAGSVFREWSATGLNVSAITEVNATTYTFTMPANNVTVTALWDVDDDGVTATPGLTYVPWPNGSNPTGWIVGRPASGSLPTNVVIPKYWTAPSGFSHSWLVGQTFPVVGIGEFYPSSQTTISTMITLSIPETVERIGYNNGGEFLTGFSSASGLTTIILRGNNPYFELNNGVLYTKGLDTLILYPASRPGTSYTVNSSTRLVQGCAFHSAQFLTEVILPNSVKEVGTFTFNDAPNLRAVYFNGVEKLGTIMFRGTSNLNLYFRTTTPPSAIIPAPVSCVGGTFAGATGIACECINAIFVPNWASVDAYRAAWQSACVAFQTILNKIRVEGAYPVTVTGATTDRNEYAENDLVTLKLNTPIGQQFKEWQATGIATSAITQVNDTIFTFIMPANAVTLTAVYEDLVGHPLIINLSGGAYIYTGTINYGGIYNYEVTARFFANGSVQFKAETWMGASGRIPLANGTFAPVVENYKLVITSGNNRFIFSYYDKLYLDTIVWTGAPIAISQRQGTFIPDAPPTSFTMVTIGGVADRGMYGTYTASELVTITLDVPYNMSFKEWSNVIGINASAITEVNATTFTFTMPANNVAITAVYEEIIPSHAVTVTGATADKDRYLPNELVTLTLNRTCNSCMCFKEWTATGISVSAITQVDEEIYTFIMPANDVTLVAVYEEIPNDMEGTPGLTYTPWPNNTNPTGWIVGRPTGGSAPANVVIPTCYTAVAGQPQSWLIGTRLPVIGISEFYGTQQVDMTTMISISIPETVERIGYVNSSEWLTGFGLCEGLTTIILRGNNPRFELKDGVLYTKGLDTLVLYPAGHPRISYTINDGTVFVQGAAFQSAQNLVEVIVSNSVKEVGTFGFALAPSIKQIYFGENLEKLGTIMFNRDPKLGDLELYFSSTTPPVIVPPSPFNGVGGTFAGSNNVDLIGGGKGVIKVICVPAGAVEAYKTAWQNIAGAWISNLLTLIKNCQSHSVTVIGATADQNEYYPGDLVTLTLNTPVNKHFKEWNAVGIATNVITEVDDTTHTFTMPNNAVTLTAIYEDNIIFYTVSIQEPEIGGTIAVMNNDDEVLHGHELEEGTELILIATAHEGFKFVDWWHGGTDTEHIHVLDDHVTISATFVTDDVSIAVTIGGELFVVYPNPTTEMLHIQTEQLIKQIFVLDLSGKVVMQLQGHHTAINLQSIPTGNYIVRIHTETAIIPVKIIKQ
ncbi:MAG: leucine-rich repeat protein [Bacteroidales bacterium]|jgi:hypothetical protein|nr:leucine-rich repeat protein [Bacteroidales bacterium]